MLQVETGSRRGRCELDVLAGSTRIGGRAGDGGEASVVQRAQAGDPEAVSALYRQHAPRLQRFFLARLGGRQQQAEDLTAEVFVRALERLGGYEDRGLPFGAWLFRVARNLLADQHRGQPRDPLMGLEECSQVDEPAAERALERVLERQDLLKALRRLTADQRQVLELRFVRGYSIAETQAATGRSEESVKKLQARALQRLREWLYVAPAASPVAWAESLAVG